jgi:DNA-binding transcriptional ArsR family regulator
MTTTRPFPAVRIVSGAAFELIAQLAAFMSGPARGSLDAGKAWVREVRALAGEELLGRVERYTLGTWAELATVALEAAEPRGVGELLAAIDAIEPEAFRLRLLGADSAMTRSMVPDGAIEAAAAGDRAARASLHAGFGTKGAIRTAIDRVLDTPADELRADIRTTAADWAERVLVSLGPASLAAVERDVAARNAQLATDDPSTVVTQVTRGVTYEAPAWIDDVVIVPTVALRPFIVPMELRQTALFLCSVADESLETDPAAPPHRLIKAAAALGDERRLRILHLLRAEALTASEIAERLGVDRTSLHHHLGILRSAGLLAIRDEGLSGWRYTVRDQGLRQVGPELDAYLRLDGA